MEEEMEGEEKWRRKWGLRGRGKCGGVSGGEGVKVEGEMEEEREVAFEGVKVEEEREVKFEGEKVEGEMEEEEKEDIVEE